MPTKQTKSVCPPNPTPLPIREALRKALIQRIVVSRAQISILLADIKKTLRQVEALDADGR